MAQQIILIDKNPAVRALANLALSGDEFALETIDQYSQAKGRILATKPQVVLCSSEIAGLDPIQLIESLYSELPETKFVLLAADTTERSAITKAEQAGFHSVLLKPFKSNKLRELITSLANQPQTPRSKRKTNEELRTQATTKDSSEQKLVDVSSKSVSIQIEDPLRAQLISRLIQRAWGVKTTISKYEEKLGSNSIRICDHSTEQNCLMIYSELSPSQKIEIPLTEASLVNTLSQYLGPIQKSKSSNEKLELPRQQLESAATLAAEVFKQLLLSNSKPDDLELKLRIILEK